MKRVLLCATLVLTLAAYSFPAQATATASFQGNCNSTFTCTFDSSRPSPGSSCSGGASILYSWDFGDFPPGHTFTSFTTISHTYASNGGYDVTLKVWCSDGSTATVTHIVCFGFGGLGCITAGGGWQP